MFKKGKSLKLLLLTMLFAVTIAFSASAAWAANTLVIDYNSGTENAFVITGPLVPTESEKVYTESELKEKFAADKVNGDLYHLTMMNTYPTKRLYTIRGVSLWDVFADAGVGADIYRAADNYLQTVSTDGFTVSIGNGLTVGGGYELSNVMAGTLDLPRYTYSIPDFYAADVRNPDLSVEGEEIPWFISFAESVVGLNSPGDQFPVDGTETRQALRPYFGQLHIGYPNLSLSGNYTYRIVFADERLSNANAANNSSACVFSLLGNMFDRANILIGPGGSGEKVRGHIETETGDTVWFEGADVASLLRAVSWPQPADNDYFSFANAAGERVIASFNSIKNGNYTLVYAAGTSADNVTTIDREAGGVKYYFDLYRNGQPVVGNINGIEKTDAPIIDKTPLQILVNKAVRVENAGYPDDIWNVFRNTLALAQAALASQDAEQAEINSALNALDAALKTLDKLAANMMVTDYRSGNEKKIVITGPKIPLESEKVYTESELKEKFAADKVNGDLYNLVLQNSVPARTPYTIRGVSLWDVFSDAGIGAGIYRNPDYCLQIGSSDNYSKGLVTNLDADRYKDENGEFIPWYIAFAETSSATEYPADGENTGNALRIFLGQQNFEDANANYAAKWSCRLVFADSPLDSADVANNSSAYVFSLLGDMYDRSNILTGPVSSKPDGQTLGEKVKGRFKADAASTVWFEGTSVASLLRAVTNPSDSDCFSFTNAGGDEVVASFGEIATGNYTLVYASGTSPDYLRAIERVDKASGSASSDAGPMNDPADGGMYYYFDLYRDEQPIVLNISGIERAGAPDKADLYALTEMALLLEEDDYSLNLWADFQVALNAALVVLENENAKQSQIDSAFRDLKRVLAAMGVLEEGSIVAEALTLTPGSTECDLNFTWYSDRVAEGASIVQIAQKSFMIGDTFPRSNSITVTGAAGNASTGRSWHKAEVAGLDPDTKYVYRVSNDGMNFSEVFSFRTGAGDSFQFIAVGDPQIDNGLQDINSVWPAPSVTTAEVWARTVENFTVNFPNAGLIASVGDNVDSGGNETQWNDFFAPSALRRMPLASAAGNHDAGAAFNWHFNNPNCADNSHNYWFKYNNALFVVLDTSGYVTASTFTQFDQVLGEATGAYPDAKWLFVIHHKSTASPGPHRQNELGMANWADVIETLMDKYQVDYVLAGHDHVYSRSYSIYNHAKVEDVDYSLDSVVNPKGTIYFTLNAAGGLKYYNAEADGLWFANITAQDFVPTFTVADVGAKSVTFTTYRVDTNEVIDTYTVIKEPIRTVHFDSAGGTEIEPQLIQDGNTAGLPVAPEKEGYAFLGWFLDEVEFDFGTAITGDITLTAKWEEIEIHVHQYSGEVTEPTCEEQGYTTYTCSCGDEYTDDYVAALGHKEGQGVVTMQPTETAEGEMTYYCMVCGKELRTEPIPAIGRASLTSAEVSAYVTKLNGNQNDLTITVTEFYSDDSRNTVTATIRISNNAAGTYNVGGYMVYVDTKGNDQIRSCYIVDYDTLFKEIA